MPPKKKPSILFIDPDKDLTEILLGRVQKEGWTGRAAKSMEQAKKMLARKAADVLVIDPEHEILFASELEHLLAASVDRAKAWMVHTSSLTRETQALWKRLGTSGILKKGDHALSDLFKRIKHVWTLHNPK